MDDDHKDSKDDKSPSEADDAQEGDEIECIEHDVHVSANKSYCRPSRNK